MVQPVTVDCCTCGTPITCGVKPAASYLVISCFFFALFLEPFKTHKCKHGQLVFLKNHVCLIQGVPDRAAKRFFSAKILRPNNGNTYVDISQKVMSATACRYMIFWLCSLLKNTNTTDALGKSLGFFGGVFLVADLRAKISLFTFSIESDSGSDWA